MAFHILSLSGGGFLGLYTIKVLEELEDKMGWPIAAKFDLIAGTSIGGIIALGLAHEIPVAEIRQAFEEQGENIFSNRAKPSGWLKERRDVWRSMISSKYDGVALRKTITDLIGEDTLIGDLTHRALVPAVNMTKGAVQAFKTPYLQRYERDHKLRAVDVAMATSAAPAYFPIVEIGDELFVDGGLYANSPDMLALHEANHFLGILDEDIRLLSVGTTTTRFSLSHTEKLDRGIFDWGSHLATTMIAAQQSSVDYMAGHRLGERYLRIDTTPSPEQHRDLALDVTTPAAQKTIRGLANGDWQQVLGDERLNQFLTAVASYPEMHHGVHKKDKLKMDS